MKQLTEFVNWVNSVKEVLLEGKGHMDHPEDLVFLQGSFGAQRAIQAILDTVKNPEAITIKWDGYPALIFGYNGDGKFIINDKHMFNKGASSPARGIDSPEKFIEYDTARGAERTGLHRVISQIWGDLKAATPAKKGYYWGDLLFSQPLKAGADGLYHFQANPEGIKYTVNPASPVGRELTGKNAAIVVHQKLPVAAQTTDDGAEPLGGGTGGIKSTRGVAVIPAAMPIKPALKVNNSLVSTANASVDKYGPELDSLFSNPPQALDPFTNLFTAYINQRIVAKNLNGLVDGFLEYVAKRPMTDAMRRKLLGSNVVDPATGKEVHTPGYLDGNRGKLEAAFRIWSDIYNLKMDIVPQLDKAADTSPVQGYLRDGTKTQEGFVSQGLKLVNRMGFSAQNLASRQKVAEVKNKSAGGGIKPNEILVIYPGGFHPFHLGHASVFDHLAHKFPSGEVYVAATDTTTERPFTFPDKKFLANQSGVPTDRFVQVKSPYKAEEITGGFDPEKTLLVFAVSEKDSDRFSFAPKRDGSPPYFQPYGPDADQPMAKHAYIYIVPKLDFTVAGKTVDSASKIRAMYADGSDETREEIIADLYPLGKAPKKIKRILDKTLGGLTEADNPNYFGGSSMSPIPGTPADLMPGPSREEIEAYSKEMASLKRFMGHR